MKNKRGIPCVLYLYIHSVLKNHSDCNKMSEKEFRSFLFQWKIPESIRPLVIREMEILGLIERKNRFLIKFNKPQFNKEDITEFYEELEMW